MWPTGSLSVVVEDRTEPAFTPHSTIITVEITDEQIKKACCQKSHAHPTPIMASRAMYLARELLTLTSTAVINLNARAAGRA